MTAQHDGSTGEQPQVTPTVTTAPARSRWSKLPAHLGRARTSTVILGVLFLAIGALYLNIRPDPPADPATVGDTSIQQPASTTAPAAPTTAEPTTSAPETTTEVPTPPEESSPTTADEPTGTTSAPDEPTETTVPTQPSGPATAPTTVSPPG